MRSQKNRSLKRCIKCNVKLTKENWLKYLVKRSNYLCTPCFRKYGKTYHKSDPNYGKKQLDRHRMRRSAVILFYGNQCASCGEDDYTRLTIDHINGGGNTHRREMIGNLIDHLYNNLINRDGYQVLCYNCNCSKNVIYKDQYALQKKKIVIAKYGGYCVECSEDRIERLTIDHKNNDGAKQRRQYGYKTGSTFYRWLINHDFPQHLGLQVLCFNCNCSKISLAKYPPEKLQSLAGMSALKASVLDGSISESAVE